MINLARMDVLLAAEVVVVKVGTNVLCASDGLLNEPRIQELVAELMKLRELKKKVILVSSGAVGAGMGLLHLTDRPPQLPHLQAVAAIGQSTLMQTYEKEMAKYGVLPAQVLLTADDLSIRRGYLNTRNALRAILEFGAIPVINENDTVSVEELHTTFGDNDRLAALVASQFQNAVLFLLTDVDGFFDGDPKDEHSHLIPTVEECTPALMNFVAEKRSGRSKGGMASKIKAAEMVTASGGAVFIVNGDRKGIISQVLTGEEVGTFFLPKLQTLSAKKRWLGYAVLPKGKVIADVGAIQAIRAKGKSLLPIGVLDCVGKFEKGDVVSLTDEKGNEFARGLTNYSTNEILIIRGKKSSQIRSLLGFCPYQEVVHHDNLQISDVYLP